MVLLLWLQWVFLTKSLSSHPRLHLDSPRALCRLSAIIMRAKQKENEKSHHAHNQHRFPNYAEFDCGILDFFRGTDLPVCQRAGSCSLRNSIPQKNVCRDLFPFLRFPGCKYIPDTGHGQKSACVCDYQKNRIGNSAAVYSGFWII